MASRLAGGWQLKLSSYCRLQAPSPIHCTVACQGCGPLWAAVASSPASSGSDRIIMTCSSGSTSGCASRAVWLGTAKPRQRRCQRPGYRAECGLTAHSAHCSLPLAVPVASSHHHDDPGRLADHFFPQRGVQRPTAPLHWHCSVGSRRAAVREASGAADSAVRPPDSPGPSLAGLAGHTWQR